MTDKRTLDELKDLGSEIPAPEEVVRLYELAFDEFGAQALWSTRRFKNPTAAAALAITESLRVEGNLAARRLAEQIEKVCRATL